MRHPEQPWVVLILGLWPTTGVDQQARIAVTPTWVRFYDFGAGRLPKSLQYYIDRDR